MLTVTRGQGDINTETPLGNRYDIYCTMVRSVVGGAFCLASILNSNYQSIRFFAGTW